MSAHAPVFHDPLSHPPITTHQRDRVLALLGTTDRDLIDFLLGDETIVEPPRTRQHDDNRAIPGRRTSGGREL